jgi:hypothetical protein
MHIASEHIRAEIALLGGSRAIWRERHECPCRRRSGWSAGLGLYRLTGRETCKENEGTGTMRWTRRHRCGHRTTPKPPCGSAKQQRLPSRGSIHESCAVSRLAQVSHVMHMLGRRPRPFSTHGVCMPRLALVRARWRCAGRRSSRLIRLSKCGNRGEDGERREDKRGPQANDRNSLEHREFSKVVVRSTLLSVSFTPAMLNIN